VIVPCSGIGKTYGSVSREAAYDVTQDLRPDAAELVPLSLLVLGDEAARSAVAGSQTITIDGCKLACATKMVKESGGVVAKDYAVLDVYRRYKQFKPQGIAELNEGGQQLARALAQEIAQWSMIYRRSTWLICRRRKWALSPVQAKNWPKAR
jgi:uncharacterized metal-binding protein